MLYSYCKRKQLILFVILQFILLGHFNKFYAQTDTSAAYSNAITEYLKAVYKRDKTIYDTLYFGKHIDFPDIKLPSKIMNTKIILLAPEKIDIERKYHKNLVYVNLFTWFTNVKIESIFVTFYPGYLHQFDYFINFKFNPILHKYELINAHFKNYAFK